MKRIILPLVMAALCGLAQAASTSADYAQAVLSTKSNEFKVEQVTPSSPYFESKETAKLVSPAWHYVRIPYELHGKCRDAADLPIYVDELKVHVYLVFNTTKDLKELIMLDREVTYVNIPLIPKRGAKMSSNEQLQAAVFISPSDAARICAKEAKTLDKVDLSARLCAVAVEFRFNGTDCMKPESETDVLVNKKCRNMLKKNWWKKNAKNDLGVKLRSIAETPFAASYAPAFPPVSPMFGEAYTASSLGTSADGYSTTGGTDTGYSTSDTAASDADTEAGADDVSTKKSKKRRK